LHFGTILIHNVKGSFFWGGDVAAHCKIMGHYGELRKNVSTDRDAVLDEDSGGSKEPYVRWVRIPKDRGNFRGLSEPFKNIGNLPCKRSLQHRCRVRCRRDHSVCQASANSILKIYGRRRRGGIAQRGRSLISTVALFGFLFCGVKLNCKIHVCMLHLLFLSAPWINL